MIEIIPAIMPESFDDLRDKLSVVKGLVPVVQIDVMDGKFVPPTNWPLNEERGGHFDRILSEEEGLPMWEDFDFEIDMMVSNPLKGFENWAVAGARRIIIHIESVSDFRSLLDDLRGRFPKSDGESITIDIGVALNTTTPNESIEPFLPDLDFVQFMGIERVGYQGQLFDERVLDKITRLRGKYPDYIISVDGAVNLETAPKLLEAGATRLAVGSAIFASENPHEVIKELEGMG